MNTYDPMDRIVYRHIVGDFDSYAVPLTSSRSCTHLPPQYANRSRRTRLAQMTASAGTQQEAGRRGH